MLEKSIAKFNIKYLQVLNKNGLASENIKLNKSQIKQMYEHMILTRVFDEKAVKLQRQGRIGTYAPMIGQEACQTGSVFALDNKDFIFPAFRENGIFIYRGIKPEKLYLFWSGDERGMQLPRNSNMAPVSITVGGHIPHATGAAMAFKYQRKKRIAVTYFGDGATSEGDFHEALNFAGAFKAPVVFICQNNQFAISIPVTEQTASKTIAQKAIAYGIEGIQVDGNDVFAVYKATKEAAERARLGKGPTLIECYTYRIGDHTTSDDSKKYRKESDVKKWMEKDPILRLKKYMIKKKILSKKYEEKVRKDSEKIVNDAVNKFESTPTQDPKEIFNYIFAGLTPELKEQQENIILPEVKEKKDVVEKK